MDQQTTITLSDTNLDFSINWTHPSTMSSGTRKYNPLYRHFRDKLFNHGMVVIKTNPTNHDINSPYTTIDHLMTTSPQNV